MIRKVAIVGKGPTACQAPFQDSSWEIWGLAGVLYPREDRTFDIHHPQVIVDGLHRNNVRLHLKIARNKPLPIIGYSPSSLYERTEEFPFERVLKEITGYLESSIAYMIALAILEKVDEIGIWGVSMSTEEEYIVQKANCEYLIGLARGRGISVHISPGVPLFMSEWVAGRYGVTSERRFK